MARFDVAHPLGFFTRKDAEAAILTHGLSDRGSVPSSLAPTGCSPSYGRSGASGSRPTFVEIGSTGGGRPQQVAFVVPLDWLRPASERPAQPSGANIMHAFVRKPVYLLIYSRRPSDQRSSSHSFPR
jgi:hypothetical protein